MKNKKVIIIISVVVFIILVASISIVTIQNNKKNNNSTENTKNKNNIEITFDESIIENDDIDEEENQTDIENDNIDISNIKQNEDSNINNSNQNITSNKSTQNATQSQSNQNTSSNKPSQNTEQTQSPQSIPHTQNNIAEFPTSISMLPSGDAHLSVGDTYQLKISTNPTTIKNSSGTWASSDNSIATVDSNGKVTGIKNGFCKITYTSANGLTSQKQIGVYYTVLGTKNFERTVYNANGIVVKANNFIYDMSATSSPFYFTVTNNSSETINVYVSTTSSYSYSNCGVKINGKNFTTNAMSSICIANNLVNDTTRKNYISIYQDYFRINQIKQINSMSFYLIICDGNNHYKYSTDLITINF